LWIIYAIFDSIYMHFVLVQNVCQCVIIIDLLQNLITGCSFTTYLVLHFIQTSRFLQQRVMTERGSSGVFLMVNWSWPVMDTQTGLPAVTSIHRTLSCCLPSWCGFLVYCC